VRELVNLPGVAFAPIARDMFPEDLKSLPRARRRIAQLLAERSSCHSGCAKSFSLDFLLGPSEFKASDPVSTQLSSVDFRHTNFIEDSKMFEPNARVTLSPDSKLVNIPASVAFRSIGYKSEPLPGFAGLDIPFDHSKGVIPNQLGRVVSQSSGDVNTAAPLPGLYAAGWVKRGPTGVIASTMEDAFATADNILHDLRTSQAFLNHDDGGSTGLGWDGVKKAAEIRGLRRTSWLDWKRIDEVERERGQKLGKEREKISDVVEMLDILDA
jgi:adrenodoxin-NADP+ reductase